MNTGLTDRQQRELEYHREHAKLHQSVLSSPFPFDVLNEPGKRWWNAYWSMYAYLVSCDLKDKRVLVVGCGFGDDALRLSKLGARVSAFDLSSDSLRIAKALALREGLEIAFDEMPAERMIYEEDCFDFIVCRDILHHVDIQDTVREIVRVAKRDAILVVNEIYSHSITDTIRHSSLIEKCLYPMMTRLIYGPGKPYITEDERKLNEHDIEQIAKSLQPPLFTRHFNFLVTRVIPDRFETCAKLDRLLLRAFGRLAHLLAGRVLFGARILKSANTTLQ